jgi:MFS family permease
MGIYGLTQGILQIPFGLASDRFGRKRVIVIGLLVFAAGDGLADQKIGPHTRLRVVDAIVSGTHEPGTSHYELLRAFAGDAVLQAASAALESQGYLTHEFGDSVWIEKGLTFRKPSRVPRTAGLAH